jgi:hypothetical protein
MSLFPPTVLPYGLWYWDHWRKAVELRPSRVSASRSVGKRDLETHVPTSASAAIIETDAVPIVGWPGKQARYARQDNAPRHSLGKRGPEPV